MQQGWGSCRSWAACSVLHVNMFNSFQFPGTKSSTATQKTNKQTKIAIQLVNRRSTIQQSQTTATGPPPPPHTHSGLQGTQCLPLILETCLLFKYNKNWDQLKRRQTIAQYQHICLTCRRSHVQYLASSGKTSIESCLKSLSTTANLCQWCWARQTESLGSCVISF